jgi:hypothetical protein
VTPEQRKEAIRVPIPPQVGSAGFKLVFTPNTAGGGGWSSFGILDARVTAWEA